MLMALASCTAPPLERYIRLEAVAVPLAPLSRPALAGTIQLLPFRARGLLSDRHVVYLDASTGQASPSASLVWEEAPSLAAAWIAGRVWQAAGVASAVLPPDVRGLGAFWIDGNVERFELVVRPGAPERVAVAIEFTVSAGRERRPAMIARYCRTEPSGTDTGGAFSRTVSALSAQLAGDMAAHAPTLNAIAADRPATVVMIGQGLGSGGCGPDA